MKKSKLLNLVLCAGIVLSVLAGAFMFGACGGEDRVEITVTGSSSVSPLMAVLADAFMEVSPNYNVVIQTSDSGKGIQDTIEGKNAFGMASRALKSTETAQGVSSRQLCIDGITLIVNKNSTVADVTGDEVYKLFAEGTAIQSQLTKGISREDGSGTRDAFDGMIKNSAGTALSTATSFSPAISIQSSTGAVLTAVQSSSSNTLGYISYGAYDSTKVTALKFAGKEVNLENIKSGAYALQRPFNIVYKGTTVEEGLSEDAKAFYDFIMSLDGQKIIGQEGYVTL